MKIGIIIHSKTGNTFYVAEKLREQLLKTGHDANIERIIPIGSEESDARKIRIETIPDIEKYDALFLGAPVRGGSVSAVLRACLQQFTSLKTKKISCFVTMFFPFSWMGGNHAISQMKKICEEKGGSVFATGIISWSKAHRDKNIYEAIEYLINYFSTGLTPELNYD